MNIIQLIEGKQQNISYKSEFNYNLFWHDFSIIAN